MALVVGVLTFALSGIFLWSGAAKLGVPTTAANAVAEVTRLPQHLARRVIRTFSLFELFGAVLLLVRASFLGAAISLGIGLSIAIFSSVAMAMHRKVPCGCFGSSGDTRPIGLTNALFGALIAATALMLMINRIEEHHTLVSNFSLISALAVSIAVASGTILQHLRDLRPSIDNYMMRGDRD